MGNEREEAIKLTIRNPLRNEVVTSGLGTIKFVIPLRRQPTFTTEISTFDAKVRETVEIFIISLLFQ